MPAPWNPPNIGNQLSLFNRDFEIFHDKAWYISVPVQDSSGSFIDLSDPDTYVRLFIAPEEADGAATVEAPLFGETTGKADRLFDWDFVNELPAGLLKWAVYVSWPALDGTRQLVGYGNIRVRPSIAFGLLP